MATSNQEVGQKTEEFSFRTRSESLNRFESEEFDFLIIGGGITGAAAARDAATRGLKVALVDRNDFAHGTSSRSSKLIHGGLRYLENFEFSLVFEALAERSLLLKTVPHLVRPLEFFLPVYEHDPNGMNKLNAGLFLYDMLALFRTPGAHRRLSEKKILSKIPFLNSDGLRGGFRYFDASMWDDVLAIETLRSAKSMGAAVANYVDAIEPIWDGDLIRGYQVQDRETGREINIHARKVIVCAGPWTDEIGSKTSRNWKNWLSPSKGVHLVFDHKKIPVPGAMVMSHPTDGRISFVIPRMDYGAGVVIVGTTDSQTPSDPDGARVEKADVTYLIELLQKYFPDLNITSDDIVSTYVGVRPLVGHTASTGGSEGQVVLQKVSREHHIESGPGGSVFVAGGKYTTARAMAEEIIDFGIEQWRADQVKGLPSLPHHLKPPRTRTPINPLATPNAVKNLSQEIPRKLVDRYGAGSLEVQELQSQFDSSLGLEPEGFMFLEAQTRHMIRTEMVVHLEDLFLRRLPLFLALKDHGRSCIEALSRVWGEELKKTDAEVDEEKNRLEREISHRDQIV